MSIDHHVQGAKYAWRLHKPRTQDMHAYAQSFNISLPLVQTLATRGVDGREQIASYLCAERDQIVGDPLLLQGALRAVERIEAAIERKERILIAGDYDVDGVTASALMLSCLVPLGAQINFFIPNRQKDGYGLSMSTVQRAAEHGYKVVITVDNGISALEPALEARKRGVDLIITDHHKPQQQLPEAYAIVNPHQAACTYPFKYFAGVGVGFKLMSLLYQRRGEELPAKVYELLTLGTIADVVPLIGENRYFVREGLRRINASNSLSMQLMKRNARCDKEAVGSLDIGFYIAPQINALGRLDDARAAVGFLLGHDAARAAVVADKLAELNRARKELEQRIVQEVVASIESGRVDLARNGVIVVSGHNWPAGVVGLVAARLVGLYGRPAAVFHMTDDGVAKGSLRSIPEIDIFEALHSVKDLMISYGGHPMAAGASFLASHLESVRERLDAHVRTCIPHIDQLRQKICLDADATLGEVNHKLADDMAYLEPFGAGNREPLFYIAGVTQIQDPVLLKGAHAKCMVFSDGIIKPVIFFNRPDVYEALKNIGQKPFSIAASLNENRWNGKVSIELIGIDIAFEEI